MKQTICRNTMFTKRAFEERSREEFSSPFQQTQEYSYRNICVLTKNFSHISN